VPAPQEGSKPAIESRIGGAGWLCPFVPIVFSCSNDENSRSRQADAPATANVRALNVQRKRKFRGEPYELVLVSMNESK
jgi:hypothetical protein